jgi:hypothetical protein
MPSGDRRFAGRLSHAETRRRGRGRCIHFERWTSCPAEEGVQHRGYCASRQGRVLSDVPHAQRYSLLSPRRKPGSINTGLWNMGPGFRRGDIGGVGAPLRYPAPVAIPVLSDGPHAKRRSVLSMDGQSPLELREQPYASARRRRAAIRCRVRRGRQRRVRPIHDVKDQAEEANSID